MEHRRLIEEVASWIHQAERVVVLTGAGISTDSGIPDFRGPQGVWTKDPESMRRASIHYYLTDRNVRIQAWQRHLSGTIRQAEPNAGHLALAELERKGRLHTLITQNVDGLHLKAGSSPERLIEIHGTVHQVKCLECGESAPMERALERVEAGEEDPPCRTCGGILKSATISFDQTLVPDDLERSELAAATCDLFMAIGTSLIVYPVAYLPESALRAGARLVVMNAEETPFDLRAAALLRESISELLPAIVARV